MERRQRRIINGNAAKGIFLSSFSQASIIYGSIFYNKVCV